MTNDEVLKLEGHEPPVLLVDGEMGQLVIYPTIPEAPCGIQVHGEEEHRWISAAHLELDEHKRIRQRGATRPALKTDLLHMLLVEAWDH